MTVALAAPAPLHDGELALLPPDSEVAALIVAASNDREVTRWTQVPEGLTLRDAGLVTAGWSMPSSTIARFVVSHPQTGVAGMVTVWVNSSNEAEVGYWLLAHARGRGIARRAVQRLCAWAFDVCHAQRLQLTTLPGNLASERVAEACGFSRDGTLVRDVKGESRTLSLWHREAGAPPVDGPGQRSLTGT